LTQYTEYAGPPRGRVLLAEDDLVAQAVTERLLTGAGFHTDAVGDGGAVLTALGRSAYDLVILDCSMPVMDGFEAAQAIRGDKSGRFDVRIPIIALTGLTEKGDRERCLRAGMDDFVGKPVERGQLLAAVERCLGAGQVTPTEVGGGARRQRAGDPEFMDGLIDRFLQGSPAVRQELQTALERNDAAELQRLAHRLRGAAGLLQAGSLSVRAGQLEQACKAGAAVRTAAVELIGELDRLVAVMDEE